MHARGEYVCIHKNERMHVYKNIVMVEIDSTTRTGGFTNNPLTSFVVIVMAYVYMSIVQSYSRQNLSLYVCYDNTCLDILALCESAFFEIIVVKKLAQGAPLQVCSNNR